MIHLIQDKPNFAAVYSRANEILVKSSTITSFPFSPKALVKELSSTPCRSYDKAQKYGLNIQDFGSNSAILTRYGERNILFYNASKPEAHTNFSILHEFGHEINKHDLSNKNPDVYAIYEIETNYFAAQLLMPEQLIRELQRRGVGISREFLQSTFGVSAEAATKRIETLAKTNFEWKSRTEQEFDDIILNKYASFLNKISPVQNYYDFDDEYARQRERDTWYR